jgi:drug/metabolite transporter (DMT)-like permease
MSSPVMSGSIRSRPGKAHILLLSVVLVWGATFVMIKSALADITPLLFNLLRMTLGTACLALFYWRHIGRMRRSTVLAGAVTGLCLATGYQFQTTGLRLTTPANSAFITGLVVVLVPLLVVVPALRPRGTHAPRWNAWLGALAAFGGIVLLTLPAHAGLRLSGMNTGDLLSLACALAFSFHMLALANFSPRFPFEQLAVLQVGFAAVFMALSLPVFEHPHVHWTPRVIVALLVAAILATATAFAVQSWAQQFLPATHTALICAMEPVFAWLTAFAFLGERLNLRSSAGALLILSGIAITELTPPRIVSTAHEAAPINNLM